MDAEKEVGTECAKKFIRRTRAERMEEFFERCLTGRLAAPARDDRGHLQDRATAASLRGEYGCKCLFQRPDRLCSYRERTLLFSEDNARRGCNRSHFLYGEKICGI